MKDVATSDKTKEAVKKVGSNIGKRVVKAGDTMLDAALMSVGGIGIAKIAQKYANEEGDSEATRNMKQITRDTLSAGVRSLTSANGASNNSNSGNGKGGSVGREVSDKVGAPSNKGIDRSSTEYQNLFKDQSGNQRDADTRSTIKAMANAGYDIDQIDKYLNHSGMGEWARNYILSWY
jgi:hypothetical protein